MESTKGVRHLLLFAGFALVLGMGFYFGFLAPLLGNQREFVAVFGFDPTPKTAVKQKIVMDMFQDNYVRILDYARNRIARKYFNENAGCVDREQWEFSVKYRALLTQRLKAHEALAASFKYEVATEQEKAQWKEEYEGERVVFGDFLVTDFLEKGDASICR